MPQERRRTSWARAASRHAPRRGRGGGRAAPKGPGAGGRAAAGAGADAIVAKGHEAGGWIGDESTFVLVQRLAGAPGMPPVWAQGGIGLHTTAACAVAGAAGAVLDAQVLLARESPLGDAA